MTIERVVHGLITVIAAVGVLVSQLGNKELTAENGAWQASCTNTIAYLAEQLALHKEYKDGLD